MPRSKRLPRVCSACCFSDSHDRGEEHTCDSNSSNPLQSLKNATSMEQGREAIAHRLIALGRAHDLLLQTSWTSASLPTVVRAAIGPFDTPGAERFIVLGAEINVGAAAVLSLALALNELCTNAVKFGALSNAEGHVEITSVLDEKAQRFN